MAQRQAERVVNSFVKGLITEAGELTFPENASIDELNCDLRRDGSRRRRLGADEETNNVLSTFTIADTDIVKTGTWANVGGSSSLEYLAIQVGDTLYFYNKAGSPLSDNAVSHTIDLSSYEFTGSAGAANAPCDFTSVRGTLVVVSKAINAISIVADLDADTITATEIDFKVRDFQWQTDKNLLLTESTSSSPGNARLYDTYNSGWTDGADPGYRDGTNALADYKLNVSGGKYPPLTHPWFSAKDGGGEWNRNNFREVYAGTSLTANGHFILDFFDKNRHSAAGLSGSELNETETSRFSSVESFGGRIFYAGLESNQNSGTVLYSRLIQDDNEFGNCYSQNDPSSEYFSDLLDTDGGEIRITGAYGIKQLYAIGSTLMVFATNGVWVIEGVDGVFKATEYAIKKVSEVGIVSSASFIAASGTPFWWSQEGIHTVQFDKVSGLPGEENISVPTIQGFLDNLTATQKENVVSGYDRVNRRLYWGWPNVGETVVNKINQILILDLELRAFIPWTVYDQASSTNHIIGFEYFSGFGAAQANFDVVTGDGDDVVTSAGDDVVSSQLATASSGAPSIALLIRDGATNKFTIGSFTNTDFKDWGEVDAAAYAEAGYDFLGDLNKRKNAPYLTTFCRQTETGWTGDETDGYDPIGESSLKVSAYWDFKSTPSTSNQEVYRLKPIPIVDSAALNTFDTPSTVVTSRVKVRGRGRSMRLRFDSSAGKDFILLGWGLIGAANARY